VLARAEQSPRVHDVVIPSSVPLMWMGYHEAAIAKQFENDEYATFGLNIPSTVAVLELMSASTKVAYIIGGDVHCASRNSVCRSDWDELRHVALVAGRAKTDAGLLAAVASQLDQDELQPRDPDAGNSLVALQRFIVSLATTYRSPVVDGRR